QERIARKILVGKEVMPEPCRIVVPKPISEVIAMPAKLRLAFDGHDEPMVRLNAKVAVAKRDRINGTGILGRSVNSAALRHAHGFYTAAAVAIRTVKPAIQSVVKPVHPMLLVARREAREQHFAHVRLAV